MIETTEAKDFPMPPIVPTLEEVVDRLLLTPDWLPILNDSGSIRLLDYKPDLLDLLATNPMEYHYTIKASRDWRTGEISGDVEARVDACSSASCSQSVSLKRAAAPPDQSLMGSAQNLVFWPGGIDYTWQPPPLPETEADREFITQVPGLSRSAVFSSEVGCNSQRSASVTQLLDEIGYDWIWPADDAEQDGKHSTCGNEANNQIEPDKQVDVDDILQKEVSSVVVNISETPRQVAGSRSAGKHEWAKCVNVNTPLVDFHRQVPNMALQYKFELDPFQKQAVLHMELGHSVLVAAHTSAGKTVVAEYAIAICRRNGTKAVYTSPIKALSNQKYRDLKESFDDVGLLTGDIQINGTASCLICTTEILRSMLYNGSDVIRDLEWVIFDEVHYINDKERGVVWEETLILLPETVGIVLLSATVPNAMDFANWIGHIKKRQVYVISTEKRPVPLEHHLYVGQGGKSRNDISLIVDERGNFSLQGYNKAVEMKAEAMHVIKPGGANKERAAQRGKQSKRGGRGASRGDRQDGGSHKASCPAPEVSDNANIASTQSGNMDQKSQDVCYSGTVQSAGDRVPAVDAPGVSRSDSSQSYVSRRGRGRGGRTHASVQQERNTMIGLVDHLSQRSLLPVVVFVFSRRRCDEISASLSSMDLLSDRQRSVVRMFIQTCLQKLSPSDRKLPQIVEVSSMLQRGIGVHHSGVLPILKETVEQLFQTGLVRLLFATETFAMGVNMPARSVVFDSLSKFDGNETRFLNAGEYTQMAGRAGRRGQDTNGTVIILCKFDVPPSHVLQTMILGKPDVLKSQFHLTYFMILNLLRTRRLRASEIMKHSFCQLSVLERDQSVKRQLKSMSEQLAATSLPPYNKECPRIEEFYTECCKFCSAHDTVNLQYFSSKEGGPVLSSGRFVVISTSSLSRRLAVILKCVKQSEELLEYVVLTLSDSSESGCSTKAADHEQFAWHLRQMISVDVFKPSNPMVANDEIQPHQLVTVSHRQIHHPITRSINVDGEAILKEVERRKLPRFAEGPLSPAASRTLNLLTTLSSSYPMDCQALPVKLGPDGDLVDQVLFCREALQRMLQFEDIYAASFSETLTEVCRYRRLQETVDLLKQQISEQAITMLPEYTLRIQALQALGYVDEHELLTLKGKVACGIGHKELMVTELMFHHVLNTRQPAEIAAILSALVFENKSDETLILPTHLEKCRDDVISAASRLDRCHRDVGLSHVESFSEMLSFGLMEVVYHWSRGMSFNQVVQLSTVQEGIIVRTIQRLDETLRDVRTAARVVGNQSLHDLATLTSSTIRRDIVVAASLYISDIRPPGSQHQGTASLPDQTV